MVPGFNDSALRRLIRRDFVLQEIPLLTEVLFACKDIDDAIRRLPPDDAQAFIDVINEVLCISTQICQAEPTLRRSVYQVSDNPDLPLRVRVRCLRPLYRACGHHGLLPTSLKVTVCYDRDDYPLYKGGCADVWKGECCGREVAVKVIRAYSRSDLQKITKVCSVLLPYARLLMMHSADVL